MFKFLIDSIIKLFIISPKLKVIEPFGEMKYINNEWFGSVEGISPDHKIELSICVNNPDDDLTEKVLLINEFVQDYDLIVLNLYTLIFEHYKKLKLEKTEEEIEKMYFLSALSLQKDHSWWLVMEPAYNVESIYNYFIRFTIIGREIVWKNIN